MTSVGAAQIEERIAALVASREELLAALKDIERAHGTYSNGNYAGCHCDSCVFARIVIRRAEATHG